MKRLAVFGEMFFWKVERKLDYSVNNVLQFSLRVRKPHVGEIVLTQTKSTGKTLACFAARTGCGRPLSNPAWRGK